MTLLDLIIMVKDTFSSAEESQILELVKELEHRIIIDIFAPAGISKTSFNNSNPDLTYKLLLGKEYLSIYIYYIFAFLSLAAIDTEMYNCYKTLFNEKYSLLAVDFRKKHTPNKNTKIKGVFFK